MKKTAVIAIPSSYIVITTTIVYALLAPIFFEMDNAYGESENFVVDDDNTMTYSQQYQVVVEVEPECKSPCPSSAEICIAICA